MKTIQIRCSILIIYAVMSQNIFAENKPVQQNENLVKLLKIHPKNHRMIGFVDVKRLRSSSFYNLYIDNLLHDLCKSSQASLVYDSLPKIGLVSLSSEYVGHEQEIGDLPEMCACISGKFDIKKVKLVLKEVADDEYDILETKVYELKCEPFSMMFSFWSIPKHSIYISVLSEDLIIFSFQSKNSLKTMIERMQQNSPLDESRIEVKQSLDHYKKKTISFTTCPEAFYKNNGDTAFLDRDLRYQTLSCDFQKVFSAEAVSEFKDIRSALRGYQSMKETGEELQPLMQLFMINSHTLGKCITELVATSKFTREKNKVLWKIRGDQEWVHVLFGNGTILYSDKGGTLTESRNKAKWIQFSHIIPGSIKSSVNRKGHVEYKILMAYYDPQGTPATFEPAGGYFATIDLVTQPQSPSNETAPISLSTQYLDQNKRPFKISKGYAQVDYVLDPNLRKSNVKYFDINHKRLKVRCEISSVFPDSVAEGLGIREGDVILTFNNSQIESVTHFLYMRSSMKDESEKLEIDRNGKHISILIPKGILGIGLVDNFEKNKTP